VDIIHEIFPRLESLKLGKVFHTKVNFIKVVTFEKSSKKDFDFDPELLENLQSLGINLKQYIDSYKP